MTKAEIRELVKGQFDGIVFDLADLEKANAAELTKKLSVPLEALFDRQKPADRARSSLKGDFKKLMALYLMSFEQSGRIDFDRLAQKLDGSEALFLRHFGKDRVRMLRFLIHLAFLAKEKPKGLLGAA